MIKNEMTMLKRYYDATRQASNRTRWTVIIMVIASVLAYSAFWNSRDGSWMNKRYEVAKRALEYYGWSDSLRKNLDLPKAEEFDQCRYWAEHKGFSSPEIQADSNLARIEKCLLWEYVSGCAKTRAEYIQLIRIPFFGSAFDVNDLGIIGGFSFIVLLMMLLFSLSRELDNLGMTFKWIDRTVGNNDNKTADEHKDKYELLAMSQVLLVPPVKGKPVPWFRRYTPLVLFMLPFFVQSLVFIWDIKTYKYGLALSPTNTVMLYFLSGAFWVVIIILTVFCIRTALRIHALWRTKAEEIWAISTDDDLSSKAIGRK